MTDYFKRIDTTKLYPRFLELYHECLINCEKRGAIYIVTSGLRSLEEQKRLYDIGRTPESKARNEEIVTKAVPGASYHNFGLACDAVRDGDEDKWGVQPDWSPTAYVVLADEAKKVGLNPGYYFKNFKGDYPHVQFKFTGGLSNFGIRDVRRTYEGQGRSLENLWTWLDRFS
jgi:hypothetical protein